MAERVEDGRTEDERAKDERVKKKGEREGRVGPCINSRRAYQGQSFTRNESQK
jgi:hypothetical protein